MNIFSDLIFFTSAPFQYFAFSLSFIFWSEKTKKSKITADHFNKTPTSELHPIIQPKGNLIKFGILVWQFFCFQSH